MANEEFAELAEITLAHHHQYGSVGVGRWGSGPGTGPGAGAGAGVGGSAVSAMSSPHRPGPYHSRPSGTCYEAEDAIRPAMRGPGNSLAHGAPGQGSGMYYSPPGTSYTIVERPASAQPKARSTPPTTRVQTGKKRAISPEQVLKLMGAGGAGGVGPKGGLTGTPGGAGAARPPMTSPSPPLLADLPVRTVTMVRGPPDAAGHGFGICVKGGANSCADWDGRGGVRQDPSTPFRFPTQGSAMDVYISRVEEGSVAERAGLRPGDSILEVNGTPFSGISHEEALKMLKSCRKLTMTVRSPTLPSQHPRAPGSPQPPWISRQTYSWMDRQGRPVSPPGSPQRWPHGRAKDRPTRKVELSIEPGQSLGLMIRGGVEYNLGVFITGVDKNSVADRAGLMIGDQILEVNGQSFMDVTHDEAVSQLKLHKRMTITVRDVGKVPHSCTDNPPRPWDSPGGFLGGSGRSPALQMVEEKARVVLSKSEFATLAYYQEEYAGGQMTIEAFVAVLLELLSTPEKYTLLTELREVVAPEDRVRFDELVYRREAEGRRCRELREHASRPDMLRMGCSAPAAPAPLGPISSTFDPLGEPAEFRTPLSEDSGLGLGTDRDFSNGRSSGAGANRGLESGSGSGSGSVPGPGPGPGRCWSASPTSARLGLGKRTSDLALSPNEDFDAVLQEYGSLDGEHMRTGRRHSSPENSLSGSLSGLQDDRFDETNMPGYLDGLRSHLGGWTQKVKSWYWGSPLQLAHKLGRSFDLKDDQELLEPDSESMRRHHSMQRIGRSDVDLGDHEEGAALVVPDQLGNLRITVRKTKSLLGIAIEGGANTKHPLPRIINIHENGAAYEAGGLEVGQLILEVDGQKVESLQHQDIARLIAESFARRDRAEIEFLVVEPKKSNLEPKPTALIFLEG